jgi:mannose-6-phosphate isomerase-like protein (cupin superfamily)
MDRRHAIQWLALGVMGYQRDEFLDQVHLFAGPLGPANILNSSALRRAIRSAPEENPGHPGLYSINLSGDARYPVIGIRRTVATRSEVHTAFTDVWYVLEGSATLITGGAIIGGAETARGEIRGRGITGGESRRIRAGDFAVVPAGVAHWVSEVRKPEVIYFVVKVPTPK